MYFSRFFNKPVSCFCDFLCGLLIPTNAAPMPTKMRGGRLRECSVLRTDNCDIDYGAGVVRLTVIVEITMNFSGLGNKLDRVACKSFAGSVTSAFFAPATR